MASVYRPIRRTAAQMLDLILPPRCACCGAAGGLLCRNCEAELPRADGPRCRRCWLPSETDICSRCSPRPVLLRELRSAFVYEGPARAMVIGLKHGGVTALAETLLDAAGGLVPASDIDVLCPIPMPLLRKRQRGGNQAELLARGIAKRTGLPLEPTLLSRRAWRAPRQTQAKSHAERRTLMRGAYRADPERVADRTVLLIDDVTTSLATLEEAARTLRLAGAREVDAWTAARAELQ